MPTSETSRSRSGGLRLIVGNTAWLMGGRMGRMAGNFLVGIVVMRHLGPEQFGILSYCLMLSMLLAGFAGWSSQDHLKRELVARPEEEEPLLMSAMALRAIGALVVYAVLILFADTWSPEPGQDTLLLIVSLMLFHGILMPLEPWFHANQRMDLSTIAQIGGVSLALAGRIVAVLLGWPLEAFAFLIVAEHAGIALVTLAVYLWKQRRLPPLKLDLRLTRELAFGSIPLTIALLVSTAQRQVAPILLGNLGHPEELGNYAAAFRFADVIFYLPVAVCTAILPNLMRIRQSDPGRFQRLRRLLLEGTALGGWLVLALYSALGAPILIWLLGSDYAGAASILNILLVGGIFFSVGTMASIIMVVERQYYSNMSAQIIGLALGLVAAFALVPTFLSTGAAWALNLTFLAGMILALFLFRPTRLLGIETLVSVAAPLTIWRFLWRKKR